MKKATVSLVIDLVEKSRSGALRIRNAGKVFGLLVRPFFNFLVFSHSFCLIWGKFGHDHLMTHKYVHVIRLRENSYAASKVFVNFVDFFKDLFFERKNLGPHNPALQKNVKPQENNWKWFC